MNQDQGIGARGTANGLIIPQDEFGQTMGAPSAVKANEQATTQAADEEDFLAGKTACNLNETSCESCQ